MCLCYELFGTIVLCISRGRSVPRSAVVKWKYFMFLFKCTKSFLKTFRTYLSYWLPKSMRHLDAQGAGAKHTHIYAFAEVLRGINWLILKERYSWTVRIEWCDMEGSFDLCLGQLSMLHFVLFSFSSISHWSGYFGNELRMYNNIGYLVCFRKVQRLKFQCLLSLHA